MKELIEALQIMLKYGNPDYPFHCEHDTLHVIGIPTEKVSEEDIERLYELGFFVGDEWGTEHFMSFRYGSA